MISAGAGEPSKGKGLLLLEYNSRCKMTCEVIIVNQGRSKALSALLEQFGLKLERYELLNTALTDKLEYVPDIPCL